MSADQPQGADFGSGFGRDTPLDMISGFVAVIGRPNVGKSTLVNRLVGTKVSIVSDKPQTTRTQIRGVLNRFDAQLVFVDTPGIHKPRTPLGNRLNDRAQAAASGVDLVCVVLDGASGVGRGDERVLRSAPADAVVVLNKVDGMRPELVAAQLATAARFAANTGAAASANIGGNIGGNVSGNVGGNTGGGMASPQPDRREYFPVSAISGEGVSALLDHLLGRLPTGPAFFPRDEATDNPEAFWVAELVREQLLARTEDELPHSIATRVTEWDWPYIRCEILVERDSQKGIVIGHGGAVLKAVGSEVRKALAPGAYLELAVKVERNWQRRPASLDRLGF
ncbi:MAG: GTPase Era [Acidimicrobiales bacterium]